MTEVVVVIGAGGMGQAIARRQGTGKTVLLADFNDATLEEAADAMRGDGYTVITARVDVATRASVRALAATAAEAGAVTQVAHTAGLSPEQAPVEAILAVDLVGVALVLEEFGRIVAPGGAGVVISSMAGHMGAPLTAEQEARLTATDADELLRLPFLDGHSFNPGSAYSLAKRVNHLQVRTASHSWGARGARVNSISPGVIATPMGRQELDGGNGAQIKAMVQNSGTGRLGTPTDIADAAAFLLGPTASFVTGTDLLVDGGVVPVIRAAMAGSLAA